MCAEERESGMADYKNIPVDLETYGIVKALGNAYARKMGAQVKVMAKAEYEKLLAVKAIAPIASEQEKPAQA